MRSWLRLIDPAAPSPLASLMFAVEGASAYMAGAGDASGVGLAADDAAGDVTVTLARPASDFPDVVAGASFGIVPPSRRRTRRLRARRGLRRQWRLRGDRRVRHEPDAHGPTSATGPGRPAIDTIDLVSDLGGRSEVEVFEDGDLDYAPISSFDASWIAYDPRLGPQLREVPTMSVEYYGFDTTRAPFDDVRVRQAFGMAVDWRRIARSGFVRRARPSWPTRWCRRASPAAPTATSCPTYDPGAARALLAEAGYPGRRRASRPSRCRPSGGTFDAAIVDEVRRELGIELATETMDFEALLRPARGGPARRSGR